MLCLHFLFGRGFQTVPSVLYGDPRWKHRPGPSDCEVVRALCVLRLVDAAGLILGVEPDADGVLQDQRQDEGNDARVEQNREGTDSLSFQLGEAAAAEQ